MKTKLNLLPIVLMFLSCGSNKTGFYFTTEFNTTLYRGIQNPLKINSSDKASVDIAIQNGSLTKSNDSTYWIKPETNKGAVIITFTQNKKSKDVYFRVRDFPSPVLTFYRGEGYPNKMIPVSEFKKATYLGYKLANFEYPVHFQLLPYKITVITAEGKVTRYDINGSDRLPYPVTGGAAAGDTIIFTNLEYKLDGSDYIFKGEDCVYTLQ